MYAFRDFCEAGVKSAAPYYPLPTGQLPQSNLKTLQLTKIRYLTA